MKYIMTSFLVICFLLDGPCSADPPRPNGTIPVEPDWDSIDRAVIESSRQFVAFLKGEIASNEKMVADLRNVTTPEFNRKFPELSVRFSELSSLLLKQMEENRENLKKHERWVREMERFEQQKKQNPGSATDDEGMTRLVKLYQELWGPPAVAPPPREKK